jgi:hypothetical protein
VMAPDDPCCQASGRGDAAQRFVAQAGSAARPDVYRKALAWYFLCTTRRFAQTRTPFFAEQVVGLRAEAAPT